MFFLIVRLTLLKWQQNIQEIIKSTSQTIYIYIFDVKVEETNFVLVNLFNPNTETEQVTIFLDLGKMLEAIKDFYDEHKVLVGNVYFYFWHILGFI